jgi:hypothetical protein
MTEWGLLKRNLIKRSQFAAMQPFRANTAQDFHGAEADL